MGQKANKTTPTVLSGTLYTDDPLTTGISLKTERLAWQGWLEDFDSFYYESAACAFSCRKQHHRNGYFWYAYKRIDGTLYKRYLGAREVIDLPKLDLMAAYFNTLKKK